MRQRKKPRISWVTKTKWILRMEKIKNFIKWIANDGLQHIETIALLFISLAPIIGFGWATLTAVIFGLGRETIQFLRGENTKEQVHHDMICNGIGLLLGYLVYAAWWLSNL